MFTLNKVFKFIFWSFCIYFCFVPHIWGEVDWSLGKLQEQMVSPPEHITEKVLFGSSVAISDQYAIIGSKKDSQIVSRGGSAYIYEKNDDKWIFVKKVFGSNNSKNDYLGGAVALEGNFAFVGALSYNVDENHKDVGIVYVYQRQPSGEWIQTQTLFPNPLDNTHNFGCSLATYNTQLIVGAYGKTSESGKAFIFELENNQWVQRHCLEPEEPDIGGRFGIDVDIFNNYVIVGAYIGFNYYGAVYVFQKHEGGWNQIELIQSPSEDNFSYFGYSVCINDQYLVVGSKCEKLNGIANVGAVYVYRRNENSWELMPKLIEPDLKEDDKFGASIDLEGDLLAVGGIKMDSDLEGSGAVNIYRIEENQFVLLRKIFADQPQFHSLYGSSLAFTNDMILVASELYSKNNNSNTPGSAFFYSLVSSSPVGPDDVLGLDDVIHWLKILSGSSQ